MAERLCCRKGHRWAPTFAPNVWPPDFRSSCPVCGDAPIGPFDVTVTTARVLVVLDLMLLAAGLCLVFLALQTLGFGIILLILAGMMPLIGVAIWAARQKMKAMAAIAEKMGFAFMPRLTVESVRAVAPFQLFTKGHTQKAYSALQGRVGVCDVLVFQYRYTIGGGKHQATYTHSAVILFDQAAGVPDFLLTPRTFFDKFVGLFTHTGVELEDAIDFNKRCKLTGPDPDALRRLFHPELVRCLESNGRWHMQALNGQLILYRSPAFRPQQIPGLAADALNVRDLLHGAGRPSSAGSFDASG